MSATIRITDAAQDDHFTMQCEHAGCLRVYGLTPTDRVDLRTASEAARHHAIATGHVVVIHDTREDS